jgi:hypothetical protein
MIPVSVCIATRGDVFMGEIYKSFPDDWEIVTYDNGAGTVSVITSRHKGEFYEIRAEGKPDLGPHARFAAIEYASHDLILVQDDDVIVIDPQAIVDRWERANEGHLFMSTDPTPWDGIVANVPREFRVHYPDSALVGFGACFQRDLPEKAFTRFFAHYPNMERDDPLFLRESCRIFTTLTHRVLVDIEKKNLPYASNDDRLWMQEDHLHFRERALSMAREVRDKS